MTSTVAVLGLASMSLGALLVLAISFRDPSFRTVSWTSSASFIFGLAWIGSLGYALGAFSGQRRTVDYVFGFNTRYFGLSQIVIWSTGAISLAFCLIAIRLWVRKENPIAASGVLAASISSLGIFANSFNDYGVNPRQAVAMVATVSALGVAALMRPSTGTVLGPAVYGVTLAVLSGFVPLINSSTAFDRCRPDKCGPLGVLFLGVLGNENALGIALALSFPFVILAFRGYVLRILSSYMLALIYLTGSRAAILTAIAVLLVAFLSRPRIEEGNITGRHPAILLSSGVVAVVVGCVLPIATNDLRAFSGRGLVWALAKSSISENPLIGAGVQGWRALARAGDVSAASAYSTHNLWVDILFTTGILGLILFLFLILSIFRSSPLYLISLPLLAALFVGMLEMPWTFAETNWLVWVLPALLLLRRPNFTPKTSVQRHGYTRSRVEDALRMSST